MHLCLFSSPEGAIIICYIDQRCRGYRNGLNTIALTWVEQRKARHRFLARIIKLLYTDMEIPRIRTQPQFTDQQIIQNFVDEEYDLTEMENLFSDMLLHYVYPSGDHRLSYERTREVIEKGNVFLDLLRGIRNRKVPVR